MINKIRLKYGKIIEEPSCGVETRLSPLNQNKSIFATVPACQSGSVNAFFDIFPAHAGQDRPNGIPGSPSCPPTPGRAVGLISERLVNGRGRRARLARVRSSPLAGASAARCAHRPGGLSTGPLRPGRPPGILPEGFQPRAPAVGPCTWTGAAHRAGQCV